MTILHLLAVVAGIAVLAFSADIFVRGAAAMARRFGLAPALVGMLVIGFGTSAPEMLISVLAAAGGNTGLAIGNAFGSNIFNIGLILGLTALVAPVAVSPAILRREIPILLAATLATLAIFADLRLSRIEGGLLLAGFAAFLLNQVMGARSQDTGSEPDIPAKRAVIETVVGLLLLVASSRLLVWGAVEIARDLGVSDLLIGLTIVAAGTSLPELASSLAALRRGEHDIALGNVVGSNLFNTLIVAGLAGVITPALVPGEVLSRDLPVMAGMTFALLAFAWIGRGRTINRLEGGLLMAAFVIYTGLLVSVALAAGS